MAHIPVHGAVMPVQHLEQLALVAVPYVHPAVWIAGGQGRQEKVLLLAKKKKNNEIKLVRSICMCAR
jgi:hypothetical protein